MIKTTSSDPWIISISTFNYNLMLMFLPARFRREYGAQMAQVFRDCCLRAYRESGLTGLISFWAAALFDWLKVGIEEHLQRGTHMNLTKFIRLAGWGLILAAIALLLTFVTESQLQAGLYSMFGAPATTSGLARVQSLTTAAAWSTFFFTILLITLGLVALWLRFGRQAGGLAQAALGVGILGGAAAMVARVGMAAGADGARIQMNISMAFMFGGLLCFGLAAMWKKTMPRGNSLPVLAGIWWPLLVIDAYVQPLGTSQLGPVVPWWFTFSVFLFTSASLAGLGAVLQVDAAEAIPEKAMTIRTRQTVLILAGLVAIARAWFGLNNPDYWSPTTPLDYAAAVAMSVFFLLLAVGLWSLRIQHPAPVGRGRRVWQISITTSSLAAGVIGISNVLEDMLAVPGLGMVWVIGILTVTAGLLAAGSSAFWVDQIPRRVGILILLVVAGILGIESNGLFISGLALIGLGVIDARRG